MAGVISKSKNRKYTPTPLAFMAVAKEFQINAENLLKFVNTNDVKLMNGKISEKEFFYKLSKKFKISKNSTEIIKMLEKHYKKYDGINNDVVKIISGLKKNYTLGLVTDTYPMHIRIRKGLKTYKYFKYITTSLDAKAAKAEGNSKIYKIMLKKMKAKPAECVMIDDKKKNLLAPKKMGIKVIQFKNAKQLKRDLVHLGINL